MPKLLWAVVVAIPLAVASVVYAASYIDEDEYICPLTGEELPCPLCCPLNDNAKNLLPVSAREPGPAGHFNHAVHAVE